MKKTSYIRITVKRIVSSFALLALVASAYAQSPREELQQMVVQLQNTPNDNALREKIIQLAPTLKPSPALPDAAIAFEGRGQFAFRSATSEGDFLAAAQEYEKAVAVAPWVPGYYADLCTIYEKAGKFEDAKRHCGFYLTSLTDPEQMTDIKRRIAGLQFGIEKADKENSPYAREVALLQKVEGARFVAHSLYKDMGLDYDRLYEIKDKTLYITLRIYSLKTEHGQAVEGHKRPGVYPEDAIPYRNGMFTQTKYLGSTETGRYVENKVTITFSIRPDAQALIIKRDDGYESAIALRD